MKLNKIIAVASVAVFLTVSIFSSFGQTTKDVLTKTVLTKTDQWNIEADKFSPTGEQGSRVFSYEGKVDARLGDYRITADKLSIIEADKTVVAEGTVVFMKKEQSISCNSLEFSYGTNARKITITF